MASPKAISDSVNSTVTTLGQNGGVEAVWMFLISAFIFVILWLILKFVKEMSANYRKSVNELSDSFSKALEKLSDKIDSLEDKIVDLELAQARIRMCQKD